MGAWFEKLLVSIAIKIIEILVAKATERVKEAEEQRKLDVERGIRDEENLKQFLDAKDNESRAQAMLDLINRHKSRGVQ